eukprot:612613-Hanusia_phi.AAC.2
MMDELRLTQIGKHFDIEETVKKDLFEMDVCKAQHDLFGILSGEARKALSCNSNNPKRTQEMLRILSRPLADRRLNNMSFGTQRRSQEGEISLDLFDANIEPTMRFLSDYNLQVPYYCFDLLTLSQSAGWVVVKGGTYQLLSNDLSTENVDPWRR